MIHVLADIELAPGVRDEFIKIFKERGIAFPSDFFSDRYKVKAT